MCQQLTDICKFDDKFFCALNMQCTEACSHFAKSTGTKYDEDKLRFDLIPPEVEKALAEIITFGAKKYGDHNWKELPNFKPRFTAALMRHLNDWRSGEKDDLESGKPHLWHMICDVAFLIWEEENG